MSEAKQHGSFDERKQQAREEDAIEDCEVLIFLKTADGALNVQILPRDADPNQDSPAVILASFLNANMDAIAQAAMDGYHKSKKPGDHNTTPLKLIYPITSH